MRKVRGMAADMEAAGARLTAGITLPIAGIAAASLKTMGEIEALKKGLATLEGSAAGAERRFKELLVVAKLPGLGIQEAVRADLALRSYGFTAERAKQITLEFGNALAAAGRGKEDLEEATRQLGQMAVRGKVTSDNLRPIIERIPQAASAIREAFHTVDTEVLQKMGVSAERMTDVLLTSFSKLQRVEGGWKNSMENMADAAKLAMEKVGVALKPVAEQIANEFVAPAIERIGNLAEQFRRLPSAVQTGTIAMVALAAAAGPVILAMGAVAAALVNIQTLMATVAAASGVLGAALASPWVAIAAATAGAGLLLAAVKGLNAELAETEKKYIAWKNGSATVATSATVAAQAVDDWADNTIEGMQRTGFAVERYSTGITVVTKEQQAVAASANEVSTKLSALEKAFNLLGITSTADMKKMESAFGVVEGAWRRGEIGLEQVKAAASRLGAEYAKMASAAGGPLVQSHAYLALGIEATRSAVAGAMRAVYDFNTAGEAWGKKLEYVRGEIDDTALRTQLLRGEMERLGEVKPQSLDVDAGRATRGILETEAILRSQGVTAQTQLRAAANSAGVAYARIVELQREGKATTLDVARSYDAWTRAERATLTVGEKVEKQQNEMLRHVRQHIHQLSNDLGKLIFEGGKFGDVMANAMKRIGQSIVSAGIEKALSSIAKKLLDVADGSGILGRAIGAIFGGGGASTSARTPPFVGGSGAVVPRGASAGASGAASSLGSTADIVTGAISAGANVVSAIYNVRQEGTLNAIEEQARYSQIHLSQILESAREFWPVSKSISNAIQAQVVPALRQIRDGLKTFFTVNLTASGDEQSRIIGALVDRVGTLDTSTADGISDMHFAILEMSDRVAAGSRAIVNAVTGQTALVVGKLAAIEAKAPSTLERLLGAFRGTGGVSIGGGGGLGGVVSGLVSGGIGALFGGGKGADVAEEHARYTRGYLLALVENSNKWWPSMAWAHDRLKQIVDNGIDVRVQGGAPSIVLNNPVFYGSAKDMADEMMAEVMRRMQAAHGV